MSEDLRSYRRALALYCLAGPKKTCPSMTAGELSELMRTTAEAYDHSRACYADISPAVVAGYLATLERQKQVQRAGERHNTRHGRAEPLWQRSGFDGELEPMPDPPGWEDPEQEPEAPAHGATLDYARLDRRQLEAVASAQDVLLVALSHHVVDPRRSLAHLEPARAQAREILRAAGLEAEA